LIIGTPKGKNSGIWGIISQVKRQEEGDTSLIVFLFLFCAESEEISQKLLYDLSIAQISTVIRQIFS
jgi:hypothetical protein